MPREPQKLFLTYVVSLILLSAFTSLIVEKFFNKYYSSIWIICFYSIIAFIPKFELFIRDDYEKSNDEKCIYKFFKREYKFILVTHGAVLAHLIWPYLMRLF